MNMMNVIKHKIAYSFSVSVYFMLQIFHIYNIYNKLFVNRKHDQNYNLEIHVLEVFTSLSLGLQIIRLLTSLKRNMKEPKLKAGLVGL